MRILSKYVLKELVTPFIFALALLTFVLMMNQLIVLFNRLLGKGLSPLVAVDALVLSVPFIIALTVPMAVLVAVISCFGRLSSDNEITAIRAAGISIYSLLRPILLAGCVLAAGMTWFNNHILPETNHRLRILLTDVAYVKPALELREGVFMNDFPNASMLVEKINHDKSTLQNITLYDRSKSRFPRTIFAKNGKMEFRKTDLILTLVDGEIHELSEEDMSQYRFTKFQEQTMIFKDMASEFRQRSSGSFRGDREMSAEMMLEEIKKKQQTLKNVKAEARKLVDQSVRRLLSDSVDMANSDSLSNAMTGSSVSLVIPTDGNQSARFTSHADGQRDNSKIQEQGRKLRDRQTFIRLQSKARELEAIQKRIARLSVEVHKKYSIPVACITFILIGIPLGVRIKTGSVGIAIGLSLVFILINWAFLLGGERLADRLVISPFMAMWSNNILMAAIGILFLFQSISSRSILPRIRSTIHHSNSRGNRPAIE